MLAQPWWGGARLDQEAALEQRHVVERIEIIFRVNGNVWDRDRVRCFWVVMWGRLCWLCACHTSQGGAERCNLLACGWHGVSSVSKIFVRR